jgi:hypothetical protein
MMVPSSHVNGRNGNGDTYTQVEVNQTLIAYSNQVYTYSFEMNDYRGGVWLWNTPTYHFVGMCLFPFCFSHDPPLQSMKLLGIGTLTLSPMTDGEAYGDSMSDIPSTRIRMVLSFWTDYPVQQCAIATIRGNVTLALVHHHHSSFFHFSHSINRLV